MNFLLATVAGFVVSSCSGFDIDIVGLEGAIAEALLPLGKCQGDCNRHMDCEGTLMCFSRGGATTIPGCEGVPPMDGTDICWDPLDRVPAGIIANVGRNGNPPQLFPLQRCHGTCLQDSDCAAGLVCFFRSAIVNSVPGCPGEPLPDGADYCVDPQDLEGSVPLPAPRTVAVSLPVPTPVATPTLNPVGTTTSVPIVSTTPLEDTEAPMSTGGTATETPTSSPVAIPTAPPVEMNTTIPLEPQAEMNTTTPLEPSPTEAPVQAEMNTTTPLEPSPTEAPVQAEMNTTTPLELSPTEAPVQTSTELPTVAPVATTGMPTGAPVATTGMPTGAPIATTGMTTGVPVQATNTPVASPIEIPSEPPVLSLADLPDNYLMITYNSGGPDVSLPLQKCQGNCGSSEDCAEGLVCLQRTGQEPVPGCVGFALDFFDYCVDPDDEVLETGASIAIPPAGLLSMIYSDGSDKSVLPLSLCHGDCDVDEDCGEGLVCFFRTDEPVPGCQGQVVPYTDYCIPQEDGPTLQIEKPTGTETTSESSVMRIQTMIAFAVVFLLL